MPGAGGGKLQLRVTTVRKSWSPLAENNPAAIPTMHKRRKNSCQECLKFRPAFCWLRFPELWKLKAHLFFFNYHVILSSLPCLLVWREHVPQVKFAIQGVAAHQYLRVKEQQPSEALVLTPELPAG